MKKLAGVIVAIIAVAIGLTIATGNSPLSKAEETDLMPLYMSTNSCVPSQANPFICIEQDVEYKGDRWLSVEWGCSASKQGDATVIWSRQATDDAAVVSLIIEKITYRWQRAIGEIWLLIHPTTVVVGPDYLRIQVGDNYTKNDMEDTANLISALLGYHDVCGHRAPQLGA